MEKVITISNKNYKMKASALTQFLYKNDTGRNFLTDLQQIVELKSKNQDFDKNIEVLDKITLIITKIAYTMIKQADSTQIGTYDDFLDNIDNLYDDSDWISQVLEFGCSPLSRQLQTNK